MQFLGIYRTKSFILNKKNFFFHSYYDSLFKRYLFVFDNNLDCKLKKWTCQVAKRLESLFLFILIMELEEKKNL